MSEYIIENLSKEEIDKLQESDLDWYPDDLMSSDVCIYGTEKDVKKALKIIGRQWKHNFMKMHMEKRYFIRIEGKYGKERRICE